MAKSPELVIPLKLDMDKAFAALKKLSEEGKEAGEKTADGLREADSAGASFAATIGDLVTHQGYQIAKDAAAAMAQGYKEAGEYIKEIAKEYTDLRATMQEIAALQGKDNTGSFTGDQAKAAAAAGLKPEEWVGFQSSFQASAGAFLEGDGARMNEADAQEYQQRLAAFAKARGVDAGQVAKLGGSILQFAEGPVSVDDAITQFGRAFKTMEIAPGDLGSLLGDTNKVMAQGASADEASQLLHLGTLFNPGGEENSIRRALTGLNRNIMAGAGEDLGGVDASMSPLQKIETAARALAARRDAGDDLDEMLAEYFPEQMEGLAMKGFINRGVDDRGFERVRGFNAETADDFAATAVEDYQKTDAGRFAGEEAKLAAARILRGEDYKGSEQAKLEAKRQLTEEGAFEQYGVGDLVRDAVSTVSIGVVPGRDEQLIQERAIQNTYKRAIDLGVKPSEFGLDDRNQYRVDGETSDQLGQNYSSQGASNKIEEILKAIEKHLAKANEGRDNRPLAARPPDPRTR